MNKYINIWLFSACILIITMVVIGGITRLTHSGLSMVQWKPVSGRIPPLNETDWQVEFDHYKQYPEYKLINNKMTLDEFKSIFFWEYIHRMIGRFLGLLFVIPFCIFYYKKMIPDKLYPNLFIMFGLGFLQGLMGWYMVKSGLADNPHVSHYRLAAHFLLAVALVGYIFWTILDFNYKKIKFPVNSGLLKYSIIISVIIVLQMIYGAFTAGLKAGFAWNTFPLMNGLWIPDGLFSLNPVWKNLVENNMTVQFIHRYVGILILTIVSGLLLKVRKQPENYHIKKPVTRLAIIVWIQVILGISTLLMFTPVWMAVVHQVLAVLLFLSSLHLIWTLKQN